jgi:hypothetical protein
MNTYPISSIIVVIDKSKSRKIANLIKKYPTIRWKIINFSIGELAVLDEIINDIEPDTKYIFYTKDHFYFNKIGFIEAAFNIF